jgi:hypothetical protein
MESLGELFRTLLSSSLGGNSRKYGFITNSYMCTTLDDTPLETWDQGDSNSGAFMRIG